MSIVQPWIKIIIAKIFMNSLTIKLNQPSILTDMTDKAKKDSRFPVWKFKVIKVI